MILEKGTYNYNFSIIVIYPLHESLSNTVFRDDFYAFLKVQYLLKYNVHNYIHITLQLNKFP